MADEFLIRCPVCLHKHSVTKNISVNKILICERCGKSFEFQNALPDKDSVNKLNNAVSISEITVTDVVGVKFWLFSLLLCLLSFTYIRDYTVDMNGPGFLGFYFLLFFIVWVFSSVIRWFWIVSDEVSKVGFVLFEGVGVLRFIDGWSLGMRDFEIMIIMMVLGGFIFFLRAEHMQGSGNSSGCSGCSSGGGCGGGCGGCGG